jgi:adenylyltransferase/sulfurtransferase
MDPEGRYSRQVRFAKIGVEGQEKLRNSRVTVLGCGALGGGIAQCLGRAGVGRLRIVDRDFLEWSNLARQVLFDEEDVRDHTPKAVAAARRLRRVNSEIEVEPVVADITPTNVLSLIEDADVVADGSDNMELRFLVNDACVKLSKPWVYGGAVAARGMTMTVRPGTTACLRCVLEDAPSAEALPTCNEVGVLNTLTGLLSSIQSNEVIKLLIGSGEVNEALLRVDVWSLTFEASRVERRGDCPACALRRFDFLDAPAPRVLKLRGRSLVQVSPERPTKLDFTSLAGSLRKDGNVEYNEYVMVFKSGACELDVFRDGRVIVKGVSDAETARRVVSRYLPL